MRVWPLDLDLNRHVTNGRYFTLASSIASSATGQAAPLASHGMTSTRAPA